MINVHIMFNDSMTMHPMWCDKNKTCWTHLKVPKKHQTGPSCGEAIGSLGAFLTGPRSHPTWLFFKPNNPVVEITRSCSAKGTPISTDLLEFNQMTLLHFGNERGQLLLHIGQLLCRFGMEGNLPCQKLE